MRKDRHPAYHLALVGVMAALVYVVTMFRFPLLGSKVHFANAMCLLAGLLLGGGYGGAAAGLGSALYDLLAGGYDPLQALITFVSKFAMAWVCAVAAGPRREGKGGLVRDYAACFLGSVAYIALYMLKSYVYKSFVEPVPADTLGAVLLGKLIPALLNGAVAVLVTPLLARAMFPALRRAGVLEKISCGWLLGSAVYSSSRKIPRRRRYIFQKRKALPYPVHPGREGLFAYGMQETDGLYSHISRVWA